LENKGTGTGAIVSGVFVDVANLRRYTVALNLLMIRNRYFMSVCNYIFYGASDFSASFLKLLIKDGLSPALVVTQPDKPVGRKRVMTPPPLKQLAEMHGIAVYQPVSLKKLEPLYRLRELEYDFGVVVSYGKIIPQRILDTASVCYLNVHPSALPRFRGAAPMERTLLAGDSETEVCIMEMTAGLDEGDVLSSQPLEIPPSMDISALKEKVIDLGAPMLSHALLHYAELNRVRVPQSDTGILYAEKLNGDTGIVEVDSDTVFSAYNKVRALSEYGGAVFSFRNKRLAVYKAGMRNEERKEDSGTVVELTKKRFGIVLEGGVLFPEELQLEGKKRMNVASFLAGMNLSEGEKL
jgi:methionyl-tRNA formyltransferase